MAQHHDHAGSGGGGYASRTARPIKALSAQQIDDLRNGRAMGQSTPAELNGYPGPKHVLELADQLGLTPQQQAKASALFEQMHAEAVPLGERHIAEEAALEALFADRRATLDATTTVVAAIGRTQAELRLAHLKYHLLMAEAMTPDQIRWYAALRGYAAP